MAARLPHEVGAQVVLTRRDVRAGNESAGLVLRPVGLNAEWIDDEHERAIALVERVEMDLDVVVGGDAVAVGERGGDASMRLEGPNPEVDRFRRIPHAHVGGIGRGTRIDRCVERETREQRRPLPDGLVEHAVDVHVGVRSVDARQRNGQLTFLAVVDRTVGSRRHGAGKLKRSEN